MSQMFNKLIMTKQLIRNRRMYNLSAIFVKVLDICKHLTMNWWMQKKISLVWAQNLIFQTWKS